MDIVEAMRLAVDVHGDPYAILRAHKLAVSLMAEHGVSGWELSFGYSRTSSGYIRYGIHEETRLWNRLPGSLVLSGPVMSLWDEDLQRRTILHEIAHIRVPDDAHGPLWRAQCAALGIPGEERCAGSDEPRPPRKILWRGTCPAGHVHERSRKPQQVWSCTRCSRKFDISHVITWRKVT